MAGSGTGAVVLALIGNAFLTIIKVVAFAFSGSGAMLSEGIHSAADTANQLLLFVGVKRSERPADAQYQYGYGSERYFFALMSAVGIFVLGCGATVYHGVHSLLHPPELSVSWVTFAVLGVAFFVDGFVFVVAMREVRRRQGNLSFLQFLRTSTDPTLIAVLFEDGAATGGVVVAAGGIALSHLTANPIYDSLASIIIGIILGFMAVWLGIKNRQLLLGPAIPASVQQRVIELIQAQPSVDSVRLARTRVVGAQRFRISVELDFNGPFLGAQHSAWLEEQDLFQGATQTAEAFGELIVVAIGDEVDRIEKLIFEQFPNLSHIDIEVD